MTITALIGPMWATKSTEMLRMITRLSLCEKRCIIIKYNADTRYDKEDDIKPVIRTNGGLELRSSEFITIVTASTLSEVDISEYEAIGIDEAQFFPDLLEYCLKWDKMIVTKAIRSSYESTSLEVIFTALNGDFRGIIFPVIASIIPHCDNIILLKAVCMKCKRRDAKYSYRKTSSDKLIEIGGKELYIVLCQVCRLPIISSA